MRYLARGPSAAAEIEFTAPEAFRAIGAE